ncbi:hypothetical protein [Staphylococcus canis]|uniref:Uncharacterized protein n=1 Tax=Staphylococcus canis TaxID=2724942 RepID=A0ABS0TDK9_9STAP|nr:hypothetical protein [Staphylococcus canis]MBI5975838.1 hypothetical protein [Staphylococcus canis]
MVKVLHHYFITITICFTMLILALGLLNESRLMVTLTVIVTAMNFMFETKLKQSNWSVSKRHFIQTLVFPINIIIIAIICLIYLQWM